MIEAIHRLVPASAAIIRTRNEITADNVLTSLHAQGVTFEVLRLVNGDWDIEGAELDDSEIFELIQIDNVGHTGELMICTEACSRYGMDTFRCQAADLRQFIDTYDVEMFFDGDVIIVGEESKTITVFHHEGVCVQVKL